MSSHIDENTRRLYPYLKVRGTARARGRQYGNLAAERIALNVAHYRKVFLHKYATEWDEVLRRADALLPRIQQYDGEAIDELEAIADGSGQSVEAIVALNSRTEIVQAGYIAQCTTAAVLPRRTPDGHTLLAQNWDWMSGARATSVLLHAVTEEQVEYLSLHEAGWLVRGGMNSHGVGCVGNFVASRPAEGRSGIPLPVIGRRILLARTLDEAAGYAVAGPRSLSINYLMASADGEALDIETTWDEAFPIRPRQGLLVHTNHYLTVGIEDLGRPRLPDTVPRLERAEALLTRSPKVSVGDLMTALRDHEGGPGSICRHASVEDSFADVTLASMVMDLTTRVLWLSQGQPCENGYEEWDVFGASGTEERVWSHAVSN